MNLYLAQVNIAWLHDSIDDPGMAGLASRVGEINGLAEQSKGFVWRLAGAEITPAALEVFRADYPGFRSDRLFYNMSVWESLEDLKAYTFGTTHAELLNDRLQWIDRIEGASVALWWIPVDHRPTVAESAERLRSVANLGATPYAFTLRKAYPPPSERL